MIQNIEPHVFENAMRFVSPQLDDVLLVYRDHGDGHVLDVLLRETDGEVEFPTCGMLADALADAPAPMPAMYAFAIDGRRFFLAAPGFAETVAGELPAGWEFRRAGYFDRISPAWASFAVMCGVHLFNWYRANRFCGRCGGPMAPAESERALVCESCGGTAYPKIAPVVIVALVHTGRLLTIRYAGPRGTHRALVAGFVEFGETAEQAVQREVLEETGLRATNVRYVFSQPWGFAQELILGFTAELEGGADILIDPRELADAEWTAPQDVPDDPGNPSLTYELMRRFKRGEL